MKNMIFNQNSRKKNILKTSLVSGICNIVNIVMGFVYRTVFIILLSETYLGINGLFTNILSLLSLTELGITTAITYRFYQPINEGDVHEVGQLMNFFARVYHAIFFVILAIGLAVLPFINSFINSSSEIPSDINLRIVYLLYLAQTLSTYIFAYKQTILNADQRQYVLSEFQTFSNFINYLIQIVALVIYRNFTISLAAGVISNIVLNYFFSKIVQNQYRPVFAVKDKLSKDERRQIFDDTKATMYHKVGGTVLTSTDNIILTKFVSLAVTGIYSNYSLITNALISLLNQFFGSFTSSIGNAYVNENRDDFYNGYKKLLKTNLIVVGLFTCCLINLIDDFIRLWAGNRYELDRLTVVVLCIQFYVEMSRVISTSYTNATGLFVKDRFRPLIEAGINIIVSIIAVKAIGVAGVFIGTIISHFCTVTWREPLILYRNAFHLKINKYWKIYLPYSIFVLAACTFSRFVCCSVFTVSDFGIWILKAIFTAAMYIIMSLITFTKDNDFKGIIISFLNKLKKLRKKH